MNVNQQKATQYVKNTMLKLLKSIITPHYCCNCGVIGSLLCYDCKYYIVNEPYEGCIMCTKLAKPSNNICNKCDTYFSKAFITTSRTGGVERLINMYKFERTKSASGVLSGLLEDVIPYLPNDIIVTPVPSIFKHIRVRGYDHINLIAKEFCKARDLQYSAVVKRATNTVQRGSSRKQRKSQAEAAFYVDSVVKGARYLILDDIVTTGSTLNSISKLLLRSGAGDVWVGAVAIQPLEKDKNF